MKINKLSPNLAVKDINETVHFYTEHFGFTLVMAVPESQDGVEQTLDKNKAYVYAMIQKDNIELMLQRLDSFQQDMTFCKASTTGATVSFYMEIDGISKLHQSLKNKNLTITDLKTTWYGMKEFYVQDLNGYILGFAEKVE
ncbi:MULTISPECIES: VOC family protein [Pasteurellaceae]|uniref:VOC family protein n=1 Tax=Pasteurella atlantica TaxID=2827233 RepID=A0AAW8CRY2_9PAST|nr:VOC family protein [Pasteurella atlantica]MBR0573308.1 VOC family protein [Pasteurella atlantica]MDP8040140.1 VOC family protein [Pasteurella atlantica]MDP8042253.1 VOC family protein [Pasteurella atlantica]MDP8044440.1 VOC family protein [Pasteurella atlantica]MDP8046452.1 VOC family protein [Pasteurella atlantica]